MASLLELTEQGSLLLFAHHEWEDGMGARLNPFAVRPGEVERRFAPHFDIEPIVADAVSVTYLTRRRSA